MKYAFKDIMNEEMYDSTQVMFVTGPYNIFNNIVVDEIRKRSVAEYILDKDNEMLKEFGIEPEDNDSGEYITNSVDFNTFLDVVGIPNINGKWFCNVDLATLNRDQKEYLNTYIKDPNDNGVLIVTSTEWRDFRGYLRNRTLELSLHSHIIQLSFPTRSVLEELTIKLFKDRGVIIDKKSAGLFVMRMSNAYDDYEEVIDRICVGHYGEMDYKQVHEGLKGIDNYVIDDFLERMLKPLSSEEIQPNRRIYKMLGALIEEMGAIELVSRLSYRIDEFIEFRIAINSGVIPIKVRFSVDEAKEKLGKEHKLYNIHPYRFRKLAYVASLTSLRDWTYMKMLLSDNRLRYSQEASVKALYTLVHRSVLNKSRLENAIGTENVLEASLDRIDNIPYK